MAGWYGAGAPLEYDINPQGKVNTSGLEAQIKAVGDLNKSFQGLRKDQLTEEKIEAQKRKNNEAIAFSKMSDVDKASLIKQRIKERGTKRKERNASFLHSVNPFSDDNARVEGYENLPTFATTSGEGYKVSKTDGAMYGLNMGADTKTMMDIDKYQMRKAQNTIMQKKADNLFKLKEQANKNQLKQFGMTNTRLDQQEKENKVIREQKLAKLADDKILFNERMAEYGRKKSEAKVSNYTDSFAMAPLDTETDKLVNGNVVPIPKVYKINPDQQPVFDAAVNNKLKEWKAGGDYKKAVGNLKQEELRNKFLNKEERKLSSEEQIALVDKYVQEQLVKEDKSKLPSWRKVASMGILPTLAGVVSTTQEPKKVDYTARIAKYRQEFPTSTKALENAKREELKLQVKKGNKGNMFTVTGGGNKQTRMKAKAFMDKYKTALDTKLSADDSFTSLDKTTQNKIKNRLYKQRLTTYQSNTATAINGLAALEQKLLLAKKEGEDKITVQNIKAKIDKLKLKNDIAVQKVKNEGR